MYLSVGIFLFLLWLKQRSKTVKTAVRFSSFCPVSSSQGEPRQLHSKKVFASGSHGWSLGDLMTVYARIFGSRSKLELPVFKVMSPSNIRLAGFRKRSPEGVSVIFYMVPSRISNGWNQGLSLLQKLHLGHNRQHVAAFCWEGMVFQNVESMAGDGFSFINSSISDVWRLDIFNDATTGCSWLFRTGTWKIIKMDQDGA